MAREVRWLFGGVIVLLGLVGLILAANAHDAGIYYAGLGITACATLFIYFMIKKAYDRAEKGGEDT